MCSITHVNPSMPCQPQLLNLNSAKYLHTTTALKGFPGGSDSKESACNGGDPGLIPGLRRSPGEGKGYSLQYYCLENCMDRGVWQATVHGVSKSQTQLSDQHVRVHFMSL